MVNTSLVEKINSLPPLPKTVKEIEEAYKDPNVDAKTVANILEHDPLVVADLLKILNSPASGIRNEVKNVEQAVSLIGIKAVKDLVVSLSIKGIFKINLSPYGVSSNDFARISYFQNFLAQYLIRELTPIKVDTIRLQALLQELGKIVIAQEIILEGEEDIFRAEIEAGWSIREIEKNYLDTTTAEVTAEMLRYWGFEQHFIDTIKASDMPNQTDESFKIESYILRIVSEVVNVAKPFSNESKKRAMVFVENVGIEKESFDYYFNDFKELWSI